MTKTDLAVPIDASPAFCDPRHPVAAIVHCLERRGLRVMAVWVDDPVRPPATTERRPNESLNRPPR